MTSRVLLGSSIALLMAAAPGVLLAQAGAAATEKSVTEEEGLSEVVVTGSRIRRDVFNAPSPVQMITREETVLAGLNTTTDVLQSSTFTGGTAQINNAYGGFVTNGGPGANTIGLRGLGPGRTLVLLNGKRVSPAGSRGAVGTADLNVLPSAMIERIEVLRDGASSVYGSDAVAGVINLITRQNITGLTVDAQLNQPAGEGGNQTRIALVGGLNVNDRLSLSGSVEYYKREDLTLGDRAWTACNQDYRFNAASGVRSDFIDPKTGTYKCYPISGTGSNGVTINTIGTNTRAGVAAAGAAIGQTTFNRWRYNPAVTTGVVGWEGVGGGATNLNVRDTFDPRTLNRSLISPVEVLTGYGELKYDLPGIGGEFYAEVLANRRESTQTGFRQLSLDWRQGSPFIPAGLAGNAFAGAQAGGMTGTTPIGVRGFIGFGNDTSSQTVDFLKTSAGLRGDLFVEGWRYDASVTHSRSESEYVFQSFLTDRLTASSDLVVATAGVSPNLVRAGYTCRANTLSASSNCVPMPQLTPAVIAGELPQDWVNYVWQDVPSSTTYEETVALFNADGPLFDLPAGTVSAAVGLEYREAEIDDTPNAESQAGNLFNLTSAAATRGTDSVWEAYGELEVPLLRDQFLSRDVRFNASARYTDYDSYGDDTTYKLSLSWGITEWLSLRATKGTSYRAPALFEQFQGGTSGFLSSTNDPCNNYGQSDNDIRKVNCAAEGLAADYVSNTSVRVITSGGAAQGLSAETSENFTYGAIFQPKLPESVGELALAVDFYKIEVKNSVSRVGASFILRSCYDDPQFRAGGGYCRFINARDPGSNSLTVFDSYTNIATDIVEGIDYNARYTRSVGPGKFRANLSVTQYDSQRSRLFDSDPYDEVNGTLTNPEYTANLDLTYSLRNWTFRYGADWIAGMDSTEYLLGGTADSVKLSYDFKVPDYLTHSASVQYVSDKKWAVTVGVRNLSNETPPPVSYGAYSRVGNGLLYSGYDYVGRTGFLNVSMTF
jgi:outer membrane receptor protein involved in Fe transport